MKNKKLVGLIVSIILLFGLFLFLYYKEVNYSYEYSVGDFFIIESYNKEDNIFSFIINDEYEFSVLGEYSVDRGLITDVTLDGDCLYLEGELDFYTICKENDSYYFTDLNLIEDFSKTYQNFSIYDLSGFTYYIWDYDGFIYINEDEIQEISLFENDVYSPNLIKEVGNYLFIPNYDEEYYFSSYYLINMKKGSFDKIEIDTKIYFDIAYLSYSEKKLNIYDKKNEKVYTLKISNGDEEIKQGITYSDSELKNYEDSFKYFFIEDNILKYVLDDFEIYLNDFAVDDIIYETSTSVIFLSNDELIYYEVGGTFTKIIKYSEWEFNYDNLIFVY